MSDRYFYSTAAKWSFVGFTVLVLSTWIASAGFEHVDMALFGYYIAAVICMIGMVVRLTLFFARPATSQVLKRSLKQMKEEKKRAGKAVATTTVNNIVLQKFIWERGWYRWTQHMLIAWGCLGSFAITFGLTFQWMRFDLIDIETYQIVVFNIPTIKMAAHGLFAELVYNGLNITALMLLVGVLMALYRRINDQDVKVTQRFEFDILPLLMLLIVTVSGLLLTVSYVFFGGFIHHELALFHQLTVIIFLCYFPFGKLFHLPVRPMAASVPMNYREVEADETRVCAGCGTRYATDNQVEDVQAILQAQTIQLGLSDGTQLSDYCQPCRRSMRVKMQLNLMNGQLPTHPVDTNTGMSMPGFGRPKETKGEAKDETPVR